MVDFFAICPFPPSYICQMAQRKTQRSRHADDKGLFECNYL